MTDNKHTKRGRDAAVDDEMSRKKPQFLCLIPKNIQFPRDKYSSPRLRGPAVPVNLYIAEQDKRDSAFSTCFCWSKIRAAHECLQVGSLYVSLIAETAPEILDSFLPALNEHGAVITTVSFPSETKLVEIESNEKHAYSKLENVLFTGISLMLPFKNNVTASEHSYANFVTESLKSIGKSLGIDESRLQKMRYPLDLKRARMVREVFAGNYEVKQEILRYLMRASKTEMTGGDVRGMAREVCSMLAWNEMSLIVLIHDVLVKAKSPVLRNMGIQYEVQMFANALRVIKGSPYPQFFRYFCTGPEEQMIQRNNFRILGAVAQEVSKRLKAKNVGHFAGTSENGGNLVKELVEIHMNWLRNMSTSASKVTRE